MLGKMAAKNEYASGLRDRSPADLSPLSPYSPFSGKKSLELNRILDERDPVMREQNLEVFALKNLQRLIKINFKHFDTDKEQIRILKNFANDLKVQVSILHQLNIDMKTNFSEKTKSIELLKDRYRQVKKENKQMKQALDLHADLQKGYQETIEEIKYKNKKLHQVT